jgi:hypothetical protein
MNKEELLQELFTKIVSGEITREEVTSRFCIAPVTQNEVIADASKSSSSFSVTKMLYALGAAIVVIGIIIFVYQIWDDIGSFGHIVVTLGLGFLSAAIGSMLFKNSPENNLGTIFHFIGGMLIPGGAMVTLSEFSTGQSPLWPVAITFGIILAFYLVLNSIHKNAILTFFAIVNGTIFIYRLVAALIDNAFTISFNDDIYAYLTMVIGVSYLLLAHSFRDGWNNKLIGVLCLFGITGFLGAAFSRVFDSGLWEMFYFIVVFIGFYLAVYMRNRSILVMSTIFLIAHVSYITDKHFADSLGWPISLIILGFIFIGLGYASITINKKYIAI